MMLERIKQAALAARKAHEADKAASLTTLLSEAMMVGKNAGRAVSDAEVISVLKKTINNINETLSHVAGEAAAKFKAEKELLETFLPPQLSTDEVKTELLKLKEELQAAGHQGIGPLLKAFKAKFEGTYDGAEAAKAAKELINK
jgi:uncharacterized protein YqeY